jgi:glycosyltransferase involved in cell wall biosynthesis
VLYASLNRRVEAACLMLADVVSVTNRPTAELYAAGFPQSRGKVAVLPPLHNRSARIAEHPMLPGVVLTYVGTLYRSIRRPLGLLALTRALAERLPGRSVQLHFFGDPGDCADLVAQSALAMPDIVFAHGPVAHEHALKAMAQSGCLVNLGNATAYQTPSKLVEYAATGKPILNIVSRGDDASTELLLGHPDHLTIVVGDTGPDLVSLEQTVDFLARLPRNCSGRELDRWLEPFATEVIALGYLRVMAAASSMSAGRVPLVQANRG